MENKTQELEDRRCKLCQEFHAVEDEQKFSGSGHDVVQANTIWECDKKQFPDDEAFSN